MKRIRPILTFFMAALVLFSSTSFMVGMHKCNGEIKQVSFLTHAKGCGHEKKLPPCHRVKHKKCCENGNVVHESSDFSHHVSKIEVSPVSADFVFAFTGVVISEIIPECFVAEDQFFDYEIPIPSLDRPVTQRVLKI